MNLETVLRAMKLAGAATPAFTALFEAALSLFSESDQAQLKDAYAAARDRSDDAHDALQDAAARR